MIKHHIDTGDQGFGKVSPLKKEIITKNIDQIAKKQDYYLFPWSSPIILVGKRTDDGSVKSNLKNTEGVNQSEVYKQLGP